DDQPGAPLGMQHLLPERHRAQAFERRPVEIGPRQCRRVEDLVGVDELAAKAFAMRLGPDLHATAGFGVRRKRRASRTRRGITAGRNRRESYPAMRRAFSARQTSINSAIEMSTSATALLPVSVKLLSCGASSFDAPNPRERPIRSLIRTTHAAATRAQNHGRRHHARLRRCQATQLTKNKMCLASSCMTGSKVSTNSGGK